MLKGALNQRFSRRVAVFFQQPLIQATAVDADPNGDISILADIHHSLDAVRAADIAGVDADLGRAAFSRGDGELIVEVNICNKRQTALFTDIGKGSGRSHIGHSQAGDLTAGSLQLANLL